MDLKFKCDKKSFSSRGDAKREMKKINKNGLLDKVIKDVYLCKICNEWHLTSMNKVNARYKRRNGYL